jgi:polyribonucleotide nucleotidyltransferase
MLHSFYTEVGGRVLTIETGKLAEQANGAVTIRYGDTVVLVTACMDTELNEGRDFLQLTVDYEERHYAVGKIPGGYFRREGHPSQDATLTSRLIDRPLRPLFPKGFSNEIQVVVTLLSTDQENDPGVLSIIGASAALGLSNIPFYNLVAAVRVGYINGEFILNPTYTQLLESQLDLVVAGTKEAVVMVDAEAKQAPEEVAAEAIKLGQEANQRIIQLQEELIQTCGKEKLDFQGKEPCQEVRQSVCAIVTERFPQGIHWSKRAEREAILKAIREEVMEKLGKNFPQWEINAALNAELKSRIRASIIEKGLRPDGRGLTEIRPISCEVGSLPRTHGSALFSRGATQVLTTATLGFPREEQMLDTVSPEESKRFMHHYNFPPFSTGEVKRIGGRGRREIGHGALAERALVPVLPSEEEFPYTLRLVSEVWSSNGSTSMASVCGSSLSLMDAGVPIKTPVAGIAIGLVQGNDKHILLTDLEGIEDAFGDMDFKVAGTADGITAIQMDVKIEGISPELIEEALSQARQARLIILDKINETISAARPELSKYAPRMIKITINPDKIRNVIGPGGRVIKSIMSETKTTVDVESDGTITIGSPSEEAIKRAIEIIESLTKELEVGGVYTGKVTRIVNFGAFVEIMPGKEGLVRLAELADYWVSKVEDVVKVGDEIMVMVTGIDHLGRINLSRRAVFNKLAQIPNAKMSSGQAKLRRESGDSRPPKQSL